MDSGKYCYDYPRPALTVDIACLRKKYNSYSILLISRGNEPYKHCWALPGGFVDENESPEKAAERELQEETSITGLDLKQFKVYGEPGRDPRGHTVSVVFYVIISETEISTISAGDDAEEARWFSVDNLPEMAFDHAKIISEVSKSLINGV